MQVFRQQERGIGDRLLVGMQVALSGGERAMSGDLAQVVDRYSGVGHPGQAGVPQAVTAEVFEAEFGDDVIPVGRVTKDGSGDAAPMGRRLRAGRPGLWTGASCPRWPQIVSAAPIGVNPAARSRRAVPSLSTMSGDELVG